MKTYAKAILMLYTETIYSLKVFFSINVDII